jgi:hypothetical protein
MFNKLYFYYKKQMKRGKETCGQETTRDYETTLKTESLSLTGETKYE